MLMLQYVEATNKFCKRMETKKISFGFSKLSKKPAVISKTPVTEKKVELIECLEGQTIKIKE